VLARDGAPLVVDDLPFHHYVDADGDSVALPCTDRMISANVASLLRAAGINAVMAHKGEAKVRFNGLEAVNGDGLASGGAAPKKAPREARFAVQSKVDATRGQDRASFAPAVRKGNVASASVEEEAVEEAAEQPAEEALVADGESSPDEDQGASSAAAAESSTQTDAAEEVRPDDELTSLLSSLDEPAAPVDAEAPAEAAEQSMDPELAALLKSLG
jgi:type VI secretion system protein ImpC